MIAWFGLGALTAALIFDVGLLVRAMLRRIGGLGYPPPLVSVSYRDRPLYCGWCGGPPRPEHHPTVPRHDP